jgi:hypothetical protein
MHSGLGCKSKRKFWNLGGFRARSTRKFEHTITCVKSYNLPRGGSSDRKAALGSVEGRFDVDRMAYDDLAFYRRVVELHRSKRGPELDAGSPA